MEIFSEWEGYYLQDNSENQKSPCFYPIPDTQPFKLKSDSVLWVGSEDELFKITIGKKKKEFNLSSIVK